MTFRREHVVKRLKEAKKTQESVQSISKFIIHYNEHVAITSQTWLEIFQQASVDLQLALWYVANEVVQTAGNKRRGLGTLFKEAFRPHLERALPLTADNSRNSQFLKVVLVWEERKVFDQQFCDRLKSIIESATANPGYGKSTAEDYEPEMLSSPFGDLPQKSENKFNAYDDQDRVARAMAISQDFQLTSTHQLFDRTQKTQADEEISRKQFELNNFDITSMEMFKSLKEKSEGVKMKQQFESVASRLADLVQQMESEFDLKNQSLDHAMAAEMYFKHQQSEAIVVCKAYKNFGSRISSLKKRLREKKKGLPTSVPVSSQQSAASNDMELDDDEDQEMEHSSISVHQEISSPTIGHNVNSPNSKFSDPNKMIAMKPLEAPPVPGGTLNAVSDIMRQLMSRVNGPPGIEGESTTQGSDSQSDSNKNSQHPFSTQHQFGFYGTNPLMAASYYTTPYSTNTTSSQEMNNSQPVPPPHNANSSNTNAGQAPLPPSMKPLEAPPVPGGTLNAVSDIMRQLMSKVNGPPGIEGESTTQGSDSQSDSNKNSQHPFSTHHQFGFYGTNPLMAASYYTTPYSTNTTSSQEMNNSQPVPPPHNANSSNTNAGQAPLPPSDTREGGGITTAFFESVAEKSNAIDEDSSKSVKTSKSSIKAVSKQIDQLLSGANNSTSTSEESTPATSPVKSTYQAAPSFYSPQTSVANPYANQTQPSYPSNANYAQLYPPVVNPSYYPNFFNPFQKSPGAIETSAANYTSKANDVDLRHQNNQMSQNQTGYEKFYNQNQPTSHEFDRQYNEPRSENNSGRDIWNATGNSDYSDPRRRNRDHYRGGFHENRPYGNRFGDRGRGAPPFRGRGHWRGNDHRPQHDQDYRNSSHDFQHRGRGGHWNNRGSDNYVRGRGGYRAAAFNSHPISDADDCQGLRNEGRNENGPKTIKEVLKDSGDQFLTATLSADSDVSSSTETSPLKGVDKPLVMDVSSLNASSLSEASVTPSKSLATQPSEKEETSYEDQNAFHFDAIKNARYAAEKESDKDASHFDAIKRARNVAAEFEQSAAFVDANENSSTHDDSIDNSVPILMSSDLDGSDKSNSNSPIKPVMNVATVIKSQNAAVDSNNWKSSSNSRGNSDRNSILAQPQQPVMPNLSNIDTSSPEYAKWWFYHFGRGRGRGGGPASMQSGPALSSRSQYTPGTAQPVRSSNAR